MKKEQRPGKTTQEDSWKRTLRAWEKDGHKSKWKLDKTFCHSTAAHSLIGYR